MGERNGRAPSVVLGFVPGVVLGLALGALGIWLWLKPAAPPPPDRLTLSVARYADLPGWGDDDLVQALPALRASCARIAAAKPDLSLGPGGNAADWKPICAEAAALPEDRAAVRAFLEARLTPLAAANNGKAEGLFTGYYEPSLAGARARDEAHPVPLYGRPSDLVTVELGRFREALKGERIAGRVANGALEPYPDRAAIEAGALDDKAQPIVWVADPVEAFFLHIQGSGRIVFGDGSVMRVGFAAQNGQPYVAIGRELVRRGAIPKEEVSLAAIKAWLEAHPADAPALLASNPSYVFFRELAPPTGPIDGPPGAENVPLSAGRSLAVDRKFLALGLPLWLDTTVPEPAGNAPLRRLMMAQDTGGAIRGPVRGDVFWGNGPDAERRAGAMKQPGRYWILVPNAVAARLETKEAGS